MRLPNGALRLANRDPGWAIARIGEWGGTYAVAFVCSVSINVPNSFILQAPPYNWPASISGLINIPGLLVNRIGAFAGGWFLDRYSD